MPKTFDYTLTTTWTGVTKGTTDTSGSYSREFSIQSEQKPTLTGTADPAFKGDTTLYNPELFLLSALSSCHMLSYLFLCAMKNVHIISYVDHATAKMDVDAQGGAFKEATMNPIVVISSDSDLELATRLHEDAHKKCFIANSVNFLVKIAPVISKK